MDIQKFTQKSVEAVNSMQIVTLEYSFTCYKLKS